MSQLETIAISFISLQKPPIQRESKQSMRKSNLAENFETKKEQ